MEGKKKEGCKMDKGTYDWMTRIEAKQDYIITLLTPELIKKETKKEIKQRPATK